MKGVWFDHERGVGGGTLDLVPAATNDGRLQWLRDHGLISNARSGVRQGRNGGRKPFTIVAIYDYTDECGALLLQVVRSAPKDFRQRRPDGKGGWTWSLGKTRRVLYRLPEVRDAVAGGRMVLVVEGEKDADSLRKLGFIATCNPGGVNKWRTEYTESLRDADVVIIGDNDDPGRAHVAQVALSLHGVARRVRVLDLAKAWGECPAKGDISDWIEAGGTAEGLAAFIEMLPEWAPAAAGGDAAGDTGTVIDDAAEIERLAKLSIIQYEREREVAAQRLFVRAQILDALVAAKRKKVGQDDGKQGRSLNLSEPEPWPEEVNGAELLSSIASILRRHVVLPEEAADTVALWSVFTHVINAFMISPRLAILSPTKGCGKTTLMDCLAELVRRPLKTSNCPAATLFRTIEKHQPTLLIDEAEHVVKSDNSDVLVVLNSGHRQGERVPRCVGDDHEVRLFSTFAAVAFALNGRLPPTQADRSIHIKMRRRMAREPIELFRLDRADHLRVLARKATRWTADNLEALRRADPDVGELFNRVADNWRSLLAIADAAGGDWPRLAREAAAVIAGDTTDEEANIQLLADIQDYFAEREVDRAFSADLVKALVALEGRPWAEWGRAEKPMTQHALARQLKKFEVGDHTPIAPGSIRIGNDTSKGYLRSQFDDAFQRYLLPRTELSKPSHRHNVDNTGTSAGFPSVTTEPSVTVGKCEKLDNGGPCNGVTDADPRLAREANGNGEADHRCDHCGYSGASGQWDWPGRPDGIWLHPSCEAPWYDSERGLDDRR